MTDQELQAIRDRCYTAMAGPWLAHTSGSRGYGIQQSTMPYRDVLTQYPETGIAMDAPDTEFMAAARSDIPALLDALDEAQERIDELEQQVAGYRFPHDFGLPSSRTPERTCALCGAIYAAPDGKGTPCAEMQRIWQDSRPRE